jgi:hypothetical protein
MGSKGLKQEVFMSPEGENETQTAAFQADKVAIKFPVGLTLIALALGFVFEILFYEHRLGISFLIWSGTSIAALVGAAIIEGKPFNRWNLVLLVPILFFASMVFFRNEPLSIFLNVVITLSLFAVWVRSFRKGGLLDLSWLDFGAALIWVPLEAWIRPWRVLGASQRKIFRGEGRQAVILALLRGILLALPVVVIFLALLTAADLIFAERVQTALSWLDLDRLADLAGRITVILLSAVFFLGAIVVAMRAPEEQRVQLKVNVQPFLGLIESLVVLGAVDLLFMLFVGIQFRYLFGGETNISLAGYTYSEYARRGFGELVAVGILSLALILGLAWWTKRGVRRSRLWFNSMSSLLVMLVGVILVSALTRLLLYEQAYGFTRLRTYTHVFIPWMGILLLIFLGLLIGEQLKRFALAVTLVVIGFAATLNILNIDAFIVEQNGARMMDTGELDIGYLVNLSEDAVPGLIQIAQTASQEVRSDLLPELACWGRQFSEYGSRLDWPSANLSRSAAMRAFEVLQADFKAYRIFQGEQGFWHVRSPSGTAYCAQQMGLSPDD